ncbi:MAG TPA: SpvB/TcaC N-terminal domain-containing protein, partial [Blastocatellia bacterium]|nr:SpvB/TcaC N-terminal domain-containing protein [Blastocatellia bacterium]
MRDVRSQESSAGGKDANAGGGPSTNPVPAISLPKGGGAIRGIGEKFGANPVTGTGSLSVPLATSHGRSGFGPQLSLSYDSGAGNGPFGLGWNLSLPAITRKTDKGLPRYEDTDESDVFILSGAEDLVPVLRQDDGSRLEDDTSVPGFTIHRYRPRIEGLFARIERWTNRLSGEIHWRSITRDNITTLYGKTAESRIVDPSDSRRIFSWLICESYDDKGNAIVYEYAGENDKNVDGRQANERNRQRTANRYLKRINYGNRISRLIQPDLRQTKWMFEVVFDYDEDHYEELDLDPTRRQAEQHRLVRAAASPGLPWTVRPDPFSTHRSCFEVRTYRRCRRVLMFHHFDELGDEPCLVRSTEFDYAGLNYSQPITIEDELAHQGSTRFASFIRSVTQSGYVRDDSQPVLERNGVTYVTYLRKSLPPLEFEYSKAAIQDDIREIDAQSLENLPAGLDGAAYQWVDLDGEGVSGILTEQADAWFYKPNLGEGHFGSLQTLATIPAARNSAGQKHQFLDLAGDGQLDVVQFGGPVSGFYERTDDAGWNSFTAFSSLPNLDWGDPNLRFVDLTGDGHADILITEDDAFTWLPSLAEEGFGPFERVRQALDEEKGPKLVFADGTQSIYLADMCADGLADLVRIRNGEICYWPNLGYGRFGAKVTMDRGPWFDNPDQFDPRRVRLADIDGSGTTDIIYLGRDNVFLYFNQSGNSFSDPRSLNQFPQVDSLSSIMTADLLGNGTACLVWSSPLPGDAQRPMLYIDLMGGQKPHLLTKSVNNLGAETRVNYAASTKLYLADKLAGKPWITKIPFPVHVVERVETYDYISRNRFVTRYAYHHGYFDGVEREFRGFGMVEQTDTEELAALTTSDTLSDATNIDPASHVPPMLTKTWFHTGAWFQGEQISRQFEHEYYREGDPSLGESGLTEQQLEAMLLPDTSLPDAIKLQNGSRLSWALTAGEHREASRALKGSILRQEIYALDQTEEQDRPYIVSERNYTIEMLQPQHSNKYAVFFAHPREQIDFHYERKLFDDGDRKLADPRVTHAMTLSVDGFGNVLESVAIGYGRRRDDPNALLTDDDRQKQKRTLITLTENRYTKPLIEDDDYRAPVLCETVTYEVLNLPRPRSNEPLVTNLFRFEEMRTHIGSLGNGSQDIAYENFNASGVTGPCRRPIERVRTLFRRNDLSGPMTFGELESKALPFESYKLAFTPGLLSSVYQRNQENQQGKKLLPDPASALLDEGGYVDLDGDGHWWIPSGRVFFSPVVTTPADELTFAREHFFLPHRFQDPFLNNAFVSYDKSASNVEYNLLISSTRDAAGNEVRATNDYRVLQPRVVTDPNGNRSAVAFDALGMIAGTAVMGKETEHLGDSLEEFEADLDDAAIIAHLQDPFAEPHAILGQASTRLLYDLHQYERTRATGNPQPSVVYTLARETHAADLAPRQVSKIQHSFSYSDGFGREIQKKIQAEPGPLDIDNAGSSVIARRWVGSGWTIFNNKGKPVRQYEPFFSATHQFEFARRAGVSPILFYDPVERVVATLHPNHTFEKVVFDPWRQETWDVNDTVLQSPQNLTVLQDPKNDPDVVGFFRRLPDADYLPTWYDARKNVALGPHEQSAALKASVHAQTPTLAYFDTLGRTFLTIAHNKFKRGNAPAGDPPIEEFHATRVVFDIEGNQRAVIDAKDRVVM